MFSGREKTFAVVVLLFAASAVSASPTIVSDIPTCSCSVPISSDHAGGVVACDLGYNAVCDRISVFGKAFFQLPLPDGRTPAVTENNRCLPAVPPSITMVLTGFLCISLVRDRKTWLTVLVGLFAIGQAGINALPELSRLGRRVHSSQLIEPAIAASYNLEDGFYPESFSNETQYTGLLHHLEGIPQGTSAFSHIRKIVIPSGAEESALIRGFRSAGKDTRASQHAIVPVLSFLNTAYDCLARPTEQFVCFSPAFIFNLIPRGPPISQMRLFCKPQGV